MNIWIFQTGEPLHIDRDNARPMRAINLTNQLVEMGHEVTVWTSTFYHQKKEQRFLESQTIQYNEKIRYKTIFSPGYKKNIGLGRMLDHLYLGIKFRTELKKEDYLPDAAFIGFPPMEVAYFVSNFLKKNKVAYIIDVKDPWPSHLVDFFPKIIQPLIKLIFFPYFAITKSSIRNSYGISAITNHFIHWARKISNTDTQSSDFVFPLTNKSDELNLRNKSNLKFLNSDYNVSDQKKRFIFVGSIVNTNFNFEPIIQVAQELNKKNNDIEFLICGDGNYKNALIEKCKGLENIIFTGWITKEEISKLAKSSIAGLAPYRNNNTFKNTISNKIIDYLSNDLPVLTSINGNDVKLLEDEGALVIYDEKNFKELHDVVLKISEDKEFCDLSSSSANRVYNLKFEHEKVYKDAVKRIEELARK